MTSVSDSLRRAIRAELAELAARGMSQREVAGRIGVTQAAVSKIAAAGEVGAAVAQRFCLEFGGAEHLEKKHRTRPPATFDEEIEARTFLRWVRVTPAVAEAARRPGITVLDLLRLRTAEGARQGEASVAEVLAHIEALRHDDGIPSSGTEVSHSEIAAAQVRKKTGRSK